MSVFLDGQEMGSLVFLMVSGGLVFPQIHWCLVQKNYTL